MKIFGQRPERPTTEYVVIPRGDKSLVFHCNAVLDYAEFEKLCPAPTPPVIRYRDGRVVSDVNDARFKTALSKHIDARYNWTIVQGLKETPGLEWEYVVLNNPDTWDKYEQDLRDGGLTQIEINYIIQGVMSANSMDEKKMKEARERFLASQQAPAQ